MTSDRIAALFLAMTTLAAIPSASVMLVVAKSVTSGFKHGAATALGILGGDFLFILFAIYSLSTIAARFELIFALIRYFGAVYLIWLGVKLWCTRIRFLPLQETQKSSYLISFLSGLSLTLADSKAILFYMSFFPVFLDLKTVSILDVATVMAIATIAVGGVKLAYAYLAVSLKSFVDSFEVDRRINLIAGSMMIGMGVLLVINS
ncbi:MAG: LysE family translocator [Cyanobacteria bacterium J06623_7]